MAHIIGEDLFGGEEFGMIKNGKFSNKNNETIAKLKDTITELTLGLENKDLQIDYLKGQLIEKQNKKIYI